MKKLCTFGALRMYFMNINRDKDIFRAYLKANYTPEEQDRIKRAFLSLGSDAENQVQCGEALAAPTSSMEAASAI